MEIANETNLDTGTFVVGINGLSRAGKSTFSHALFKALREINVPSLHMRLEDWILPPSDMHPAFTLQERTRIQVILEILDKVLKGAQVTAPGYDPALRDRAAPISYELDEARVLILDGLFTFADSVASKLDLKVFIDISDETIIDRFKEFYRWKGLREEKIETLLKDRMGEEWPTVREQKTYADLVVNLPVEGYHDYFHRTV